MENELRCCKPHIIKSKTNSGDLAKTYCRISGRNKDDVALIINRYILSKEAFKKHGVPVKKHKGYILYQQFIAIRYSTLNEIIGWVLSLNVEKEFK